MGRECAECRIEKFLQENHMITPTHVRHLVEDAVRTKYCLGCAGYLFKVDNYQPPKEGGK